jgi:nicotinamidase-related amidase
MDAKRTALLILDLQNDVIGAEGAFAGSGSPAHAEAQNVVANVRRLADAARKAGTAVIHVHHFGSVGTASDADSAQNAGLWKGVREVNALVKGSWGAQPVPGLEPQEGDTVIEKQRVSAFFGTPLDVKLRGLGVQTVIVTGAWTNMSVESTIRYGADLGYEMVLVSDGTSTIDADWQKAAEAYAVTNLAEVKTTDELVSDLGG